MASVGESFPPIERIDVLLNEEEGGWRSLGRLGPGGRRVVARPAVFFLRCRGRARVRLRLRLRAALALAEARQRKDSFLGLHRNGLIKICRRLSSVRKEKGG